MKKIQIGLLFSCCFLQLFAQKNKQPQKPEQCATMVRLQENFNRIPGLKEKFNKELSSFNSRVAAKATNAQRGESVDGTTASYLIPVVFHIVLQNPDQVTDAQIMSQLNVLNTDFAGTNSDASAIPAYFKPLLGKSSIQFCMAQRTPDGEITNGIDRVVTNQSSFSSSGDGVKFSATGGVDIWDGSKYYNVWICPLSNNLLGYATFPNDGKPLEQGVVVEYRSLPGGPFANYNGGKTLTHETGHYFNLYHIWGDDGGTCTGDDYVADTPNQGDATSGCYNGIKTDNCTTSGNGILYEDYMDYSNDQCLLLFTPLQVSRMESALIAYRSSLLSSDGCQPVILKNLDAQLKSVPTLGQRSCSSSYAPVITLANRGYQTLTTAIIKTTVDNGTAASYNWSGSLASLTSADITLPAITISQGIHQLQFIVISPNGGTDENHVNDTLNASVQYFDAVQTISEGFEGNTFPPQGWDVVNPDKRVTWQKITGVSKTGNASVWINNFDYPSTDQKDYLRMPEVNLTGIDSAFLFFQIAASTYTPVKTEGNNWDTLEVLLSKDCGLTYTSLYKKWGGTLVTTATENTLSFVPSSAEWRRDSINITPYINNGKILMAFRSTNGYENNIYLDDVNIKTITINPNLKAAGYLVTPNPAHDNLQVQFYPNPANLKGIQLFNLMGQKVAEIKASGGLFANAYSFDMRRYAAGAYFVRVVFADRVLIKKIIKK